MRYAVSMRLCGSLIFPAEFLEFELTETILIDQFDGAKRACDQLRERDIPRLLMISVRAMPVSIFCRN